MSIIGAEGLVKNVEVNGMRYLLYRENITKEVKKYRSGRHATHFKRRKNEFNGWDSFVSGN